MNIKLSHTVLLALFIAIALITLQWKLQPPRVNTYGEAQIGGHFTLTGTGGDRVSDSHFAGKQMIVYMGYSQCPDICPTTLSMLSDVLKKLGEDANKVSVVFISLDSKHDTPQILAKYLKTFDPRITGLVGSEAEIQSVIHAYKGFAKPAENPGPGNGIISHSGLLYLMDGRGKYIRHFENGVSADEVVKAVKEQKP